jgi:type I restriction enzyme S subunit
MIKYDKYKDSGVDWLGNIPEHWEDKRIKDIFKKIGSGTTPSTSREDYYENGNIFWLNTTDLNNDLVFDTKQKITQIALKESGLKIYPVNSLAIAMYGQGKTRGTVGLLQIPTATNQAACIMYAPKGVNTKYVLYWFIHKYEALRSINIGATQPNMNQDFVKFLRLQCPPIPDQTAIASYLDLKTSAIDRKVALLEQKIIHYQQLRKSLINETVCRGLDKNAKLKDSGIEWIGMIPEHWEVRRFKSFAQTIKGKNLDFSDVYFEKSLPNLSLEYLRNDEVVFQTYCYSSSKSLLVNEDDYIIVWDGAGVGEILNGKKGYLSSTIAKIVVNAKLMAPKYFFHLRDKIEYTLKQIPAGMGIPHLNPFVLNNFPCPFPPLTEQTAIAVYLDEKTQKIDSIVSNIKSQIETLKELRKTLINDVVTGKIKVTD